MKQLSALDATFLHLESEAMPMHVGAAHVFALPEGFKGRFVTRLREHMAQRLPLAPVLRRRLWWMPLNLANPAWVDAKPDLRYHIVEVKLPRDALYGDGMTALATTVGQLHGQLLDRDRPLWRMHVLEGLPPLPDGRRRVGLFTQFHHAAVDGQAAVALAQVILDLSPHAQPPKLKAGVRKRVFELGAVEMLRGAIVQEAQQLVRIVRQLPGTASALADAAGQALNLGVLRPAGTDAVSNLTLAPRTPFNVNVMPGRQFAALSVPMEVLREVAQEHEVTLNDMVLYLCSTGLRRYLANHGGVPRKSLVAAVPISLRAKGDTSASNQASMSLVSLGTQLADARRRLAHIKTASVTMKSTVGSLRQVLPTDLPSIGIPWLTQALAGLYNRARLAERVPPVANLVISNVPGPPVPLYLAGAHMLCNHPTSIVAHGLALNITVQSYQDQMDFGLVADAHAVPDLAALAEAIRAAFDDLPLLLPQKAVAAAAAAPTLPDLARAGQRMLGQAQRQLLDSMTGAVGGVMKQAMQGAVSGVLQGAIKGTGAGRGSAGGMAAKLAAVGQAASKGIGRTIDQVTGSGAGKSARRTPKAPAKRVSTAPAKSTKRTTR
jgi:diacylglycerol O-acyltransferase / wax synthase